MCKIIKKGGNIFLMKNKGNVLWGIVFLAIGILLSLNALGITHLDIFFRGWWTLIIIIPSAIGILQHPTKVWPYVCTIIGLILLMASRGIIHWIYIYRMFIPVLLIIIGILLIRGNIINKKTVKEKYSKLNSIKGKSVVFGERTYSLSNTEFLGDSLECSFGHIRYFMQDSILEDDQILDIDVSFGKVDIFVPKNVNIFVMEDLTLGKVNNKSINNLEEGRPTLTISASCLFGGINII